MSTPFDYVKAIQFTKEDMVSDRVGEKGYNPFIVNRALSMSLDTVLLANEMNVHRDLDNKLQFSFLLNIVNKRKRFDKWQKKEEFDDLDYVKEYFNYSNEKAIQALQVLSEEQLNELKQKLHKGGTK
jgi:hypothetical protein